MNYYITMNNPQKAHSEERKAGKKDASGLSTSMSGLRELPVMVSGLTFTKTGPEFPWASITVSTTAFPRKLWAELIGAK